MLEFLSEVWCIGGQCKTVSYWIGSAIGMTVIIGLFPAIGYIFYKRMKKNKKKSSTSTSTSS